MFTWTIPESGIQRYLDIEDTHTSDLLGVNNILTNQS